MEFNLFPNPASDYLNLYYKGDTYKNLIQYEMFSIQGVQCTSSKFFVHN
jgi:hypothetical protein